MRNVVEIQIRQPIIDFVKPMKTKVKSCFPKVCDFVKKCGSYVLILRQL